MCGNSSENENMFWSNSTPGGTIEIPADPKKGLFGTLKNASGLPKKPILDKCPFCRATHQDQEIVDDTEFGSQFYVRCNKCGATGPDGETAWVAADKWNRHPIEEYLRKKNFDLVSESNANQEGWDAASKLAKKLDKKVKKLKAKIRRMKENDDGQDL